VQDSQITSESKKQKRKKKRKKKKKKVWLLHTKSKILSPRWYTRADSSQLQQASRLKRAAASFFILHDRLNRKNVSAMTRKTSDISPFAPQAFNFC
jgi:hypothetical protein